MRSWQSTNTSIYIPWTWPPDRGMYVQFTDILHIFNTACSSPVGGMLFGVSGLILLLLLIYYSILIKGTSNLKDTCPGPRRLRMSTSGPTCVEGRAGAHLPATSSATLPLTTTNQSVPFCVFGGYTTYRTPPLVHTDNDRQISTY